MRLIKVMMILGMTTSLVTAQVAGGSILGQENDNSNVGNIAAWNWDVTNPDTVLAVTDSRGLIAGVDVDNDGFQEIWTSHYSSGGGVAGFEMINDTTLEMIYWDTTGSGYSSGTRYVQVGDVDNDGLQEIIYFAGRYGDSQPKAGLYIVECIGDNAFADPVFFGIGSLGFVFNGSYGLTQLLVENFIVDDVDQDGWEEIIFASNRSSFVTDYKDTLGMEIDTVYVVSDTTYVVADTTYVVADTTITPADTTIVVLADTTIITIVAADTTYIAADTTYIAADTTYILADTTYTDVYDIDTYGHSEDFFGVLHATGDLQGGFHIVEPEFFTSARDIDMGQVDTSSALFGRENRLGGGSALSALVADTDGDGLKELILHSWNYFNTTIVEATGPDTYSFGDTTYVRFTYPSDHVNLKQGAVTDIDGDGDDEVFMSDYNSGDVYMIDDRDGDATHFTEDEMIVILSEELQAGLDDTLLAGFSIAAGDLDGDDMPDLYVASWSSKDYDIVDIELDIGQWHYTPLLTDSAAHSQSGDFAITIAIADLDGDGHQELVTGHQGVPDSIEVDGVNVANTRAWTIRVTEYDPLFGVFGPLSTREMRIITPNEYKLAAAYPNPFNPITTIEYSLPIRKEISLIVYNLRGQEVVRLVDREIVDAGTHEVIWNGRDTRGAQVASGTYIYVMKYGNFKKSHRVTLLK